jgi:hypothetical protein
MWPKLVDHYTLGKALMSELNGRKENEYTSDPININKLIYCKKTKRGGGDTLVMLTFLVTFLNLSSVLSILCFKFKIDI